MLKSIIILAFSISFSHANRCFSIDYNKNQFLKDGKPFQYIAGSIHYFRVPEKHWKDRMIKLRAMGCNVLETYISWNWHQTQEGFYDFSNGLNVTKYISLAQRLDLLVILRPGPFIDAETDSGGFPAWLQKVKPPIKFRSSDPRFISAVSKWYNILLPMIKPLLYPNGGPIIMVQVENEYGSYVVCDKNYTIWLRDIFKKYLGEQGFVYFTTDGGSAGYLHCTIPQVYATVDFGPSSLDQVKASFQAQRSVSPKGPLVNSEFYPGWFEMWGEPSVNLRSIESIVDTMTYMYQMNASFTICMAHGGTNFGYSAAAEAYPNGYGTVVTSFDFRAPISEAGLLTPKYFAIRQTIERLTNKTILYNIPSATEIYWYGEIRFSYLGNMFDLLHILSPLSIRTKYPISAEEAGQNYGFLMYEAEIPVAGAKLFISGIHDRGYIFLNGALKAILQRPTTSNVTLTNVGAGKLQILVENQGRICYGGEMNDNKGILYNITLDGKIVTNWKIYFLNFTKLTENIQSKPRKMMKITRKALRNSNGNFVPSIFAAEYEPKLRAGDTYLDTTGWEKGQAFTGDGTNIGRYWPSKGPQITLYHPFINEGANKLIMFELEKPGNCDTSMHICYAKLINYPIWKFN